MAEESVLLIKSADPNLRPVIFLYDAMKTYDLQLDTMTLFNESSFFLEDFFLLV